MNNKFNKLRIFVILLVLFWSASGQAVVIATMDASIWISSGEGCSSNHCITPPDFINLTLGYDNNPDRPNTSYKDLYVFDQVLTGNDIGNIYHIDGTTSVNFDYFVSHLTNGIDEAINYTMWIGYIGGIGRIPEESDILNFQSGYTGGPDLIGYDISRIDFHLTSLVISNIISPYIIQSYYEMSGVFSIHGVPHTVSEPPSLMIILAGSLSLILSRRYNSRRGIGHRGNEPI